MCGLIEDDRQHSPDHDESAQDDRAEPLPGLGSGDEVIESVPEDDHQHAPPAAVVQPGEDDRPRRKPDQPHGQDGDIQHIEEKRPVPQRPQRAQDQRSRQSAAISLHPGQGVAAPADLLPQTVGHNPQD